MSRPSNADASHAHFLLRSGPRMKAAAILGLGSSMRDLRAFQIESTEWVIGLPATPDGLDAILVLGGDGTMHRHLGALVKLGLPVLVVPAGSGNDFARSLGLLRVQDSVTAWRKFLSSSSNVGSRNVRRIDLGLIRPLIVERPAAHPGPAEGSTPVLHNTNAVYFCCAAGVGLDGEISRRANALPRWLRAHGGYALSLPAALLRFQPCLLNLSVAISDGSGELSAQTPDSVTAAIFANAPFYGGGMKIAPRAVMDDGQLDVCVIRDMSKLKLIGAFPSVYFGRHLGIGAVEYFPAACVRVETDRHLDVYADGEFVCRTPVEIGVAKLALQVIAS